MQDTEQSIQGAGRIHTNEKTHLIVVRERDDRGAHAEDHRRVDLAVRVRAAVLTLLLRPESTRAHRDHT